MQHNSQDAVELCLYAEGTNFTPFSRAAPGLSGARWLLKLQHEFLMFIVTGTKVSLELQ